MCARSVYIHAHVRFAKSVRNKNPKSLQVSNCVGVGVCGVCGVCVWHGRVRVCKDTVGRCVAGNNASA